MPVATELGLPASADAWLSARSTELDQRLKRFARLLDRGRLEGVTLVDGRLQISPVRAAVPDEALDFADRLDALMPRVRVT